MANSLMEMFKPRQVYTPTDAMMDVGQAQNALASGRLTSMKANALGQEMADNEAINQVMTANGGDLNSAMQDHNLNWKAKQQIGGMISEQNKAQADSQLKRVESQIKNWQYAGNRVGSAQSQEDWDAAREEVRSVLGDDFAKNLPEQWSPEVAQKLGDAAMTHAEKIAQQREERQSNYQNQSLDLQERRLQNAERNGGDGGGKPKNQLIYDDQGRAYVVDVNNPDAPPRPIKTGENTQGSGFTKAISEKAPTMDQSNAALYGARMGVADKELLDLQGKYSPTTVSALNTGGITGYVTNLAAGDEAQKASQSQRDFVNAVLRRESGAAISPTEFSSATKQYFPQEGDSDAVISQKAQNRAIAIQGINNAAGKAAFTPNTAPALSGADAQAMEWAKANQGDPRSAAIMQRLGGR